ncbi:MAG: polyamine aminopropyltransferase [Nitrospirota bacterium]|jgi:spermidine synthase
MASIKFTETAPFVAVEYTYEVEKVLYKAKTPFQEIVVFENPYFGRMLILDGIVQLTERDEFFYHEMLTHVAMHAHPDPRTVVVIGGGDGGTVREVCKHRSVEKIYFVEIDEQVIEASREFFPTVASSVGDPRVDIRAMDGAEFIKGRKGDVDVVIVDSTDPIGFARTLFSEEFFTAVESALSSEGMYVTHSESLLLHPDVVGDVQRTLRGTFPVVDLYATPLATYPGNWWAFPIASKKHSPREMRRPLGVETRFYSEEFHAHSFLPRGFLEKLVAGEVTW